MAGTSRSAACIVTAARRRGPLNSRVRMLVTPIDSNLVSAGASSGAASGPVAFCSEVILQPESRAGAAVLAVPLAQTSKGLWPRSLSCRFYTTCKNCARWHRELCGYHTRHLHLKTIARRDLTSWQRRHAQKEGAVT